MIERFNFYDIYGYLLPGTLLLGLFWLPFGGAMVRWPAQEISTTLLLIALAYIAGHLLQTVASTAVQSSVRRADVCDGGDKFCPPSSILLDQDDKRFSEHFKAGLAARIMVAFGLEILKEGPEKRADQLAAFRQARSYLIHIKAASYVEQYEGLYAMMRGLGCAFFVGCAYLLGWALSFHWQIPRLGAIVWLVLAISCGMSLILSAVLLEARKSWSSEQDRGRWLAFFLLFIVLGLGYFLGTWFMGIWTPFPGRVEFFLWLALPLTLVAGFRCLRAYHDYAQHFAETVWRDFSGLYQVTANSSSSQSQGLE